MRVTLPSASPPRPSPSQLFTLAALLLALASPAAASVGDRSPAYHRCLAACDAVLCSPSSSSASTSPSPSPSPDYPPSLFLPFPPSSPLWSCPSTCSYACQMHLTSLSLSLPPSPSSSSAPPHALEGLPLGRQVQFHGKWPFTRLSLVSTFPFSLAPLRWMVYLLPSAQEPLSVLFSLGNLHAHYLGLHSLLTLSRTGRMSEGRTLARCYALYAASGVLTWIASAIFHTRDTPATERADYLGAGATMLAGLWAGVVRTQGWYAPLGRGKALSAPSIVGGASLQLRRKRALAFSALCILTFLIHAAYLTRHGRFDYTYNMRFNVLVALSTIALWALWTARQARLPSPSNFSRRQLSSYPSARARFRAPHYLSPLVPLLALPALTALELLDFAPVSLGLGHDLRLLDAHALWHLSTIPVVRAWYAFLVKDVRWIDGQGEGGDPSSVLPGNSASGTHAPASGAGVGGRGGGSAGGLEHLLSGAALAKRRMTGLGAGLGLGIFGGWDSRRGSAVAPPNLGVGSGSGLGSGLGGGRGGGGGGRAGGAGGAGQGEGERGGGAGEKGVRGE
ncbi:hypothetical protein JCM10213_008275 [Rhodosporidiobolus nylandii]